MRVCVNNWWNVRNFNTTIDDYEEEVMDQNLIGSTSNPSTAFTMVAVNELIQK